jgi:hypothetical protein
MADRIENINPGTKDKKAQGGKIISSKGRLLVTVFIIMMVMAYLILGISYLDQLGEHEALAFQIAEIKQTLTEIPQPAEDLEQQLADAQASQTAERSSFPREINTTELIDTILDVAEACGVKATPMLTQPWTTEIVGEHSYPVLRLTVDVEGSLSQLVAFTDQLENEGYTTLVMEELSATWGAEEEDGTIPLISSLKLAIYTRSLSSY